MSAPLMSDPFVFCSCDMSGPSYSHRTTSTDGVAHVVVDVQLREGIGLAFDVTCQLIVITNSSVVNDDFEENLVA